MARTPGVVEDRREQIAEAAMRVFAEKGFTRATNKDIAREAGITTGLIYHYFDSKEALLKAVVEMHSPAQLTHSLSPQMLTLSPEVFIRQLMLRMLKIVESVQFVQLVRVFLPEAIHNPKLSSVALPSYQEAANFLESYLSAKMESGELRRADPSMTAQVMMSSIMGFVLRRQVLNDPMALQYTQEEIIDSTVGLTLHGLLPD